MRDGWCLGPRGGLDPETEQNTLVVAWRPSARLVRFHGDFHHESAQNTEPVTGRSPERSRRLGELGEGLLDGRIGARLEGSCELDRDDGLGERADPVDDLGHLHECRQ